MGEYTSTESEISARQSSTRRPFVGNAEAVGTSATGTIISGIATNERVFLTTAFLDCVNSDVAGQRAGSLCITDPAGVQVLVLMKSITNFGQSKVSSLSFNTPILIETGRELRVINGVGANNTTTVCVTGWIETF
jgi:hypothetical protein